MLLTSRFLRPSVVSLSRRFVLAARFGVLLSFAQHRLWCRSSFSNQRCQFHASGWTRHDAHSDARSMHD